MKNKARKYYYRVLIGVIMLAVIYMTYVRRWGNDVFEDSSSDPGYVSASYLESESQEGMSYDHYLPEGYTLVAEGFEQVYLYPGTYRLSIDAETSSEHAFYQVIDLWTNTVLAEDTYDPTESNHWIWFTTEETFQYVVVRSYVLTEDLPTDPSGGEDSTYFLDVFSISAYSMFSYSDVVTDSKWEMLLLLFLAALIGTGLYRVIEVRRPALLTLSVMSAIVSLPFASDFLPYGHDTYFHIARIYSLGQAILDGQIPQRINTTITNGGITSIMYPELVLYGAGLMVAGGASVMLAYQVTCVVITYLTAFAAYHAARQICDTNSALLFAFLYLINPFRMNEIILRGAIGEAFAVAFLPWIVVGMWKVLSGEGREPHRAGAMDLVIGYTGLISSHIIMCVIAAFLCVIIVAGLFLAHPARFIRSGRRLLWIILAAGIVIVLNIWFMYPFLQYFGMETKISSEGYQRLQITEPYLWQIFMNVSGRSGDNGNTYSASGEMSFSIGIALLLGGLLFVCFLLHDRSVSRDETITAVGRGSRCGEPADNRTKESRLLLPDERRMGLFCGAIAVLFLYMSSTYFPWDWVLESSELLESTLGRIQFSWRLLAVAVMMLSAVLVIVIRVLHRSTMKYSAVISGGLILISILTAMDAGSYYYSSEVGEMDGKFDASYSIYHDYFMYQANGYVIDEWYESGEGPLVLSEQEDPETQTILLSAASVSGFEVTDYHRDGAGYELTFVNRSGQDVTVTIPVLWYGLHTAYLVDGEGEVVGNLTPLMNETTQFTDIVISGNMTEGTVILTYAESADYLAADLISLAAWIILIVLGLISLWKRRNRDSLKDIRKIRR